MKKIILLFVIVALASVRGYAQNQQGVASQSVAVSISNTLDISIIASSNQVPLPFNNASHYQNGVTSGTQLLTINANKKFNVTVQTASNHFSYSGNATNPNMPVANILTLKLVSNTTEGSVRNSFTSFQSISTASKELLRGGKAGSNKQFSVQYQATPGFTYPGGTYSVDVIYTATQS